MTVAADRRAVLGAVLAAGIARLSMPSCAETGVLVADPLPAAIERHRRAYDAFKPR
jgi:hypothetical protein